jgi:hypothetical protein
MRFKGRSAVVLGNSSVQVSVLKEGGHIAEILHKASGVNPLWVPPWPSIEPSTYSLKQHPEYGSDHESKLLSGLMGHNLCLDLFGPPSETEAAAGIGVHGESSVVPYEFEHSDVALRMWAHLPLAGLRFTREIRLDGAALHFQETVQNLTPLDRPIAWTQHVTMGPPFLRTGLQFSIPAVKSRTFESADFDGGVLSPATDFTWPHVPLSSGSTLDLSCFDDSAPFSRFTTHQMDPASALAGFVAYSPDDKVVFGYRWPSEVFPWLGIWQENKKRTQAPWSGRSVTCGMEFGVSPYPETRRQMIERGSLFGVPGYKWLPAQGKATASYSAFIREADGLLENEWLR